MKITVEFNSLDEISEFQKLYVAGNNIIEDFIKEEVSKRMPKAAQEEASEPKKDKKAGTKKPEKVEKEPENGTDEVESGTEAEETGTAEEKVDVDALKVEVRKLLTKVNKQTGKNQAKEWIKNLGHDSLTEVDELDDLKALKALAEEELGA
jgi:hypothetical protein